MPDATNAGTPAPGGQLSGDATRQAAIKRMKKLGESGALKAPPPTPATAGVPQPPRLP